MPYVSSADRAQLRPVAVSQAKTAGHLNFQITCLFIDYFKANGLNYQHLNDCYGAAAAASAELARRVGDHYEDGKIQDNGDVYPREMTGAPGDG